MSDSALTVGSRELKTRLGAYLQQVKEGTTIVVTERGRPVAELRPLHREASSPHARLRELQLQGVVTGQLSEPRPLIPFLRLRSPGRPASEALSEDREDRF